MTNYGKPHGHDCPPDVDPADQPKPPGDKESCQPYPENEPPKPPEPEKCPDPDPGCKCPPKPGSDSNCLEDLLTKQAGDLAEADKAKAFKTELEGLLAKAKTAKDDYTVDKYKKLRDEWKKQDAAIAELIRKLVCAVPCWHCIIECHVCPLLNEIQYAEKRLYDDGQLYANVHDLYDLQYWLTRDKDIKDRRVKRIKAVLAAWEKPAQTIEKALNDNKALIEAASKVIGSEPGKAIYDVFLKLVPLHLAIAPPASAKWTTGIDKKYTDFCNCNKGTPDDCCGPDVGELSLRQRLIQPQPYLIDPNDFFKIMCCLVEKRLGPAQVALSKAEKALAEVESRIARAKTQLEDGIKNFEKNAKGAIPSVIDCCDYEAKEQSEQS